MNGFHCQRIVSALKVQTNKTECHGSYRVGESVPRTSIDDLQQKTQNSGVGIDCDSLTEYNIHSGKIYLR